MFALRTASGTCRRRAIRRQCLLQRREAACSRWSMCSARSERGGRGSWLSAASSAVESAPPLKATHSPTCGKAGSSSLKRHCSQSGPKLDGPPRRARAMCLRCVFGKHAEAGNLLGARRAQLIARHGVELIEVTDERRLETGRHGRRITMCATEGLLDELIDQPELFQPVGGEVERLGRSLLLVLALPQDRRTALGRDHRVGAVLEHEEPVAHTDAERTPRAALA